MGRRRSGSGASFAVHASRGFGSGNRPAVPTGPCSDHPGCRANGDAAAFPGRSRPCAGDSDRTLAVADGTRRG